MREEDAATAAVTAIVVRSSLPAWLRWSWAALVTVASLGGWVIDHCYPPGTTGAVMRSIRSLRQEPPPPAGPPAVVPAPHGAGASAGGPASGSLWQSHETR